MKNFKKIQQDMLFTEDPENTYAVNINLNIRKELNEVAENIANMVSGDKQVILQKILEGMIQERYNSYMLEQQPQSNPFSNIQAAGNNNSNQLNDAMNVLDGLSKRMNGLTETVNKVEQTAQILNNFKGKSDGKV